MPKRFEGGGDGGNLAGALPGLLPEAAGDGLGVGTGDGQEEINADFGRLAVSSNDHPAVTWTRVIVSLPKMSITFTAMV